MFVLNVIFFSHFAHVNWEAKICHVTLILHVGWGLKGRHCVKKNSWAGKLKSERGLVLLLIFFSILVLVTFGRTYSLSHTEPGQLLSCIPSKLGDGVKGLYGASHFCHSSQLFVQVIGTQVPAGTKLPRRPCHRSWDCKLLGSRRGFYSL